MWGSLLIYIYICMYVYMYMCIYIFIYIYIYQHNVYYYITAYKNMIHMILYPLTKWHATPSMAIYLVTQNSHVVPSWTHKKHFNSGV